MKLKITVTVRKSDNLKTITFNCVERALYRAACSLFSDVESVDVSSAGAAIHLSNRDLTCAFKKKASGRIQDAIFGQVKLPIKFTLTFIDGDAF